MDKGMRSLSMRCVVYLGLLLRGELLYAPEESRPPHTPATKRRGFIPDGRRRLAGRVEGVGEE